ncbi:hypothetical protein [Spirosoma areae]
MLNVQEPYHRAVYQRDNQNRAIIPLRGTATPYATLTIALRPLVFGEETSLELVADAAGNFAGGVTALGGWYDVTVSDGTQMQTVKAGAGEVFIVWGHSFMSWSLGSASTDERVVTLSDSLTETDFQYEQLTNRVGPFQEGGPGAWGQLGDKLVKRLNVPVLLYGTAFGGSNIKQNYRVLNNMPFEHSFIKYADRQPYRPLEKVLTDYVPRTGVRAILCEHGYNDVSSSPTEFLDQLGFVIDYTRNHFGHPDLPFVLVQEETTGQPDRLGSAAIGNALKSFIGTKPNTWQGPDFNAGYWGTPGFHDGSAHLTVSGNAQFASDWDASLTNTFFAQSKPVLSNTEVTQGASDDILYYAEAPAIENKGIEYIIWALAALFAIGLLNRQSRSKSMVGLLVLAVVFIYRSRSQQPQLQVQG